MYSLKREKTIVLLWLATGKNAKEISWLLMTRYMIDAIRTFFNIICRALNSTCTWKREGVPLDQWLYSQLQDWSFQFLTLRSGFIHFFFSITDPLDLPNLILIPEILLRIVTNGAMPMINTVIYVVDLYLRITVQTVGFLINLEENLNVIVKANAIRCIWEHRKINSRSFFM